MAEEVLPGVWQIGMGYVNAFFIARDDVVLIDSGLPKKKRAILKALRKAERKPEDLTHVAITHHHADHSGSLAAIAAATGATTYLHALDAPVVRGDVPQPGPNPSSIAGKIFGPVITRLPANRIEPATIDQELQGGEDLPIAGGLKAIHTPGHTAGHVSFLWPEHGGVLFAGDAAGHMFGRLGKPLGMFTEDMDEAQKSIRKLADLEFEAACFGHGSVIREKALVQFRRYVEKAAK